MRSRVWRQNIQLLCAQDIVLSCWLLCGQTELDRNAQLLTMAQNDVAELRMQHSEMVTSALPTRASAA